MTQQVINPDTLNRVILSEPLAIADREFGNDGTSRLKNILLFLKRCSAIAKVGRTSELLVFAPLRETASLKKARAKIATAFNFSTPRHGEISKLFVEVRPDGTFLEWKTLPPPVKSVIKHSIFYKLESSVEAFTIKGKKFIAPKVVENSISQFFLEVFPSLTDALFSYRDTMARVSTCFILREAWDDPNRLWFKTKPERMMRRALCNYLQARLRHDGLELMPEQNVDESHPVDIKIEWKDTNRVALIEIKWLGQSRNPATKRQTTKYTESRAKSGAKQLIDYLNSYRQAAPRSMAKGYLVVFDGRRKALNKQVTALSHAHGMHYENREISYAPSHLRRPDFEKPLRMFLEPICI